MIFFLGANLGAEVINVIAKDSDEGANGEIMFRILNNENTFVGMAILVHLSLVRRPYNLMPMIGNSFSFTALLNYFLLLLLLCKEVGLAEDKNFNIAIGHAHFFI